MIESDDPEIDVDALMAEIRAEVLRAREAGHGLPVSAGPAAAEGWYGVLDQLRVAEQHAAVGLEVPAFGRYGGIKRRLARAVARVVMFLTQVLAQPQRIYNASTLTSLRMLAERTQTLEAEVAALRARLARLQASPASAQRAEGERSHRDASVEQGR